MKSLVDFLLNDMRNLTETEEKFAELKALVTDNDVAAAILILADVIDRKTLINRASAENLVHELSVARNEIAYKLEDTTGIASTLAELVEAINNLR